MTFRFVKPTCLLGIIAAAGSALAQQLQGQEPAYAELSRAVLLAAIVAELRHTLPDIYSLRDMRMCEAERIKLKDGKPSSWSLRMEFNTRNQAAGYTGIRRYVAIFKNGKIAFPIGAADFTGRNGFNGIFNRVIDKQMERCPAIRDADIQQALVAGSGQ